MATSLVPRRSGGGAKEKNAWYTLFVPGTHCLRMRLFSKESRKIGYFHNFPHNVDANFNNHSLFSLALDMYINVCESTVSIARRMCDCSKQSRCPPSKFQTLLKA